MNELWEEHVGVLADGRSEPGGASVASTLQAAYEKAAAKGMKE